MQTIYDRTHLFGGEFESLSTSIDWEMVQIAQSANHFVSRNARKRFKTKSLLTILSESSKVHCHFCSHEVILKRVQCAHSYCLSNRLIVSRWIVTYDEFASTRFFAVIYAEIRVNVSTKSFLFLFLFLHVSYSGNLVTMCSDYSWNYVKMFLKHIMALVMNHTGHRDRWPKIPYLV